MRALPSLLLVAACTPPGATGPLTATAPSATTASLVSARCLDGVCSCREGAEPEDPPPPAGSKRFELKLGSGPGTVWVTFDGSGQALTKSTETAEACYYVDLTPGKHQLTIQGRARVEGEGVGAVLFVSEHATGKPWWYETFTFRCGFPGPCEADSLRDWKNQLDALPRSVQDPCGSTKLRGARWETGRLPDGAHPDAFAATFVLDVYEFEPKHGPGDCKNAAE